MAMAKPERIFSHPNMPPPTKTRTMSPPPSRESVAKSPPPAFSSKATNIRDAFSAITFKKKTKEHVDNHNLIIPLRRLCFAALISRRCPIRTHLSLLQCSFVYGVIGEDLHDWMTEKMGFSSQDAIVVGMLLVSNSLISPLQDSRPKFPFPSPRDQQSRSRSPVPHHHHLGGSGSNLLSAESFRMDVFYVFEKLEFLVAEEIHIFSQFLLKSDIEMYQHLSLLFFTRRHPLDQQTTTPNLDQKKKKTEVAISRTRPRRESDPSVSSRVTKNVSIHDLEDMVCCDRVFRDAMEYLRSQVIFLRKQFFQSYLRDLQAKPYETIEAIGIEIDTDKRLDLLKQAALSLQKHLQADPLYLAWPTDGTEQQDPKNKQNEVQSEVHPIRKTISSEQLTGLLTPKKTSQIVDSLIIEDTSNFLPSKRRQRTSSLNAPSNPLENEEEERTDHEAEVSFSPSKKNWGRIKKMRKKKKEDSTKRIPSRFLGSNSKDRLNAVDQKSVGRGLRHKPSLPASERSSSIPSVNSLEASSTDQFDSPAGIEKRQTSPELQNRNRTRSSITGGRIHTVAVETESIPEFQTLSDFFQVRYILPTKKNLEGYSPRAFESEDSISPSHSESPQSLPSSSPSVTAVTRLSNFLSPIQSPPLSLLGKDTKILSTLNLERIQVVEMDGSMCGYSIPELPVTSWVHDIYPRKFQGSLDTFVSLSSPSPKPFSQSNSTSNLSSSSSFSLQTQLESPFPGLENVLEALSISTYPADPHRPSLRLGDPICDIFHLRLYGDWTLLTIADGCSWGSQSRLAAVESCRGFVNCLQDYLGEYKTTEDILKSLLVGLGRAHEAVLAGKKTLEAGTTTFLGGVIFPISENKNSKGSQKSNDSVPRAFKLPSKFLKDVATNNELDAILTSYLSSSSETQFLDLWWFYKDIEGIKKSEEPQSETKRVANRYLKSLSPLLAHSLTEKTFQTIELLSDSSNLSLSPTLSSPAGEKTPPFQKKIRSQDSITEGGPKVKPQKKMQKPIPQISKVKRKTSLPLGQANSSPSPTPSPSPSSLRHQLNEPLQSQTQGQTQENDKQPIGRRRSISTTPAKNFDLPLLSSSSSQKKKSWNYFGDCKAEIFRIFESQIFPKFYLASTYPQFYSAYQALKLPKKRQKGKKGKGKGLNKQNSSPLPLPPPPEKKTSAQSLSSFASSSSCSTFGFCFISVGDCKAFLYSNKKRMFKDITTGNRITVRDPTDPGGRLGPYSARSELSALPDLRNLGCYYSECDENDLLLLMSDGVYDNLDPEILGYSPLCFGVPSRSWDDLSELVASLIKTCFASYLLRQLFGMPKSYHERKFFREVNQNITQDIHRIGITLLKTNVQIIESKKKIIDIGASLSTCLQFLVLRTRSTMKKFGSGLFPVLETTMDLSIQIMKACIPLNPKRLKEGDEAKSPPTDTIRSLLLQGFQYLQTLLPLSKNIPPSIPFFLCPPIAKTNTPNSILEALKLRHNDPKQQQQQQQQQQANGPHTPKTPRSSKGIVSMLKPSEVTKIILEHCYLTSEKARELVESGKGRMDCDYARYPGKMDHTTLVCLSVGTTELF